MPTYLPICLNLEGRPVLVVGAGKVATERVRELLECGAAVNVVSPEASGAIREAAAEGRLPWQQRRFAPGDTEGAFLVVVATDDPAANVAAYEEASAAGRLVNVCDDPEHCTFIFASKVRRGPLTVSVFTQGTSPALARRVRRELEGWLGPEYAELAELLAELRPKARALAGLSQPERQRIFERVVYSEALLLFREGRREEARALADRILTEELRLIQADPPGTLGTGDPGPDPPG